MGLSDERRRGFGPYVRRLADLMGLRDWTTCVNEETTSNPAHVAESECVYGQKWINVFLSQSFFLKDEKSQRQTLVHELIHAHMAPMDHMLRGMLGEVEHRAHKINLEYAIDGMASEWAPHLPLPSDILSPRKTPMGRQRPVKADTAEPKPKARPKGTAKPKAKQPKKG